MLLFIQGGTMVDHPNKQEEWEKLWKKFSEIVGFTHDNEGVISSMETQKNYADTPVIKETLSHQEEEIEQLIKHHEEDLLHLLSQARKLAKELDLSVEKELEKVKKALQQHNLKALESSVKELQKK